MAPILSHSLQLLAFASTLFSHASSTPVPVAQNEQVQNGPAPPLRRDNAYFSVLGVKGLVDGTHPRVEIRELEKDEDKWNLFLLGMWRFQNMNQKDKLSYYQIAGIHGRPHIPWDNSQQGPGNSGGGYCAHSANLFPTWHRPYLALFEEVLYLNARQVVGELQDGDLKNRYSAALPSLRLPYWDFAAVPPSGQGVYPSSFQKQRIEVKLPNGTNTIDNPLYSYQFKPLDTNDLPDSPLANWPSTVRDPTSQDRNAASRNDLVARDCDGARPNLQSRVYDVLALRKNYEDISNDREAGDSFESLHNTVHANVGSGGHMSYLGYAAFDPLFWFHHCNVDRLFALWQALNPNSYVESKPSPYSTFTTPSGTYFDRNSALTPFHRDDNGNYWSSDSVRYPSTFGYTYPELVGLNAGETGPLIKKINALYGPNAKAQNKRSLLGLHRILGAPNFSGRRQYVANIQARKFALNGSFNCYIFLSDQPPLLDVALWASDDYFVGMTGVLSQPGNEYNEKGDVETNGAVPLTAALEAKVERGELRSMEEPDVMEYLRFHLKWKIARPTGEQIPVEASPGFKVSVLWTEVEPAASAEEFPQIKGDYRVLVGATDGMPGGFSLGDILL